MRQRHLLAGVAIAATVFLVACGNDSTAPTTTVNNNAVALFVNDTFVDYRVDATGSEAWNMDSALVAFGMNVHLFTDRSAAGINAAVSGRRYLVLPEQENSCMSDSLTTNAKDAIKAFVTGGGILIVGEDYCDSAPDQLLVNAIFGYAVVRGPGSGPYTMTANAAGTVFAALPGSLPVANGLDDYTLASLPAAAKSFFDDGTNTALYYIPIGTGAFIQLGPDYYDTAPYGAQDSGWKAALAAATNFRP